MDEFERRVHTMLRDQVADLEPAITGPGVRAEAGRRRPRSHIALMAAAAAAVLAIAILPILLSRGHSSPVRPGSPFTGTSQEQTNPPPSLTPKPPSSTGRTTSPSQPRVDGVPGGTATTQPPLNMPSALPTTGHTRVSSPPAPTSMP